MNTQMLMESLRVMLFGMSGIFIVLISIYLMIKILLKVFPPKESK